MGTHPIFESDFDCLTDFQNDKMSHPMELSRPVPTFCDVCNNIAFGVLLQCANCGLICHKTCQPQIRFHCQSDAERTIQSGRGKETAQINEKLPEAQFDTIRRTLSPAQIAAKVTTYNTTVKNRLVMALRPDYSFTGYIRVELELTRPVQSNNEIIYLPKNTVKAIHLTSANTASQVIHALLAKFKIANDARKYVLCERKERDRGHVTLRPLNEAERPLFLTLLWGAAHSGHGFRLKDRMDHEPVWDDFKDAELESFLRMFHDEEKRVLDEIRQSYNVLRFQLETLLSNSAARSTPV